MESEQLDTTDKYKPGYCCRGWKHKVRIGKKPKLHNQGDFSGFVLCDAS
jgi:hypothetical protein